MANETMTSNNKPAKTEERQGIRVKGLRFSRPNGVEVPVELLSNGELKYRNVSYLSAGTAGSGGSYEIEHQPWSRRYRIVHKLKDGQRIAYSMPDTWALHIE